MRILTSKSPVANDNREKRDEAVTMQNYRDIKLSWKLIWAVKFLINHSYWRDFCANTSSVIYYNWKVQCLSVLLVCSLWDGLGLMFVLACVMNSCSQIPAFTSSASVHILSTKFFLSSPISARHVNGLLPYCVHLFYVYLLISPSIYTLPFLWSYHGFTFTFRSKLCFWDLYVFIFPGFDAELFSCTDDHCLLCAI